MDTISAGTSYTVSLYIHVATTEIYNIDPYMEFTWHLIPPTTT